MPLLSLFMPLLYLFMPQLFIFMPQIYTLLKLLWQKLWLKGVYTHVSGLGNINIMHCIVIPNHTREKYCVCSCVVSDFRFATMKTPQFRDFKAKIILFVAFLVFFVAFLHLFPLVNHLENSHY